MAHQGAAIAHTSSCERLHWTRLAYGQLIWEVRYRSEPLIRPSEPVWVPKSNSSSNGALGRMVHKKLLETTAVNTSWMQPSCSEVGYRLGPLIRRGEPNWHNMKFLVQKK
jgi:hypothetical protein